MKLKQFIFALVAMLLGFSVTASAQQLLVNCDYNNSTEGWGTTKFSNYAGAYAYATANAKTATIVIEKTNTISGNTFDNNHKNYSRLAVVIKDGATMGNAASKWDMTYPVTVEPGGTLTCARPKNSSVSNIHIKNKLIVGAKGATKKAYVNFLSDSYHDCDISIRYNGSIEVYNADFHVQDLDAQGKLTIEDSNVEVDGAFASATFYATTLTNSTITINGNQISGGLSDFSGGTSNQLGKVTLNNSTLTIKEGDTKVAANVTATNSTIEVNNLTVNSGKTLNLNDGSTLNAENITTSGTGAVKIDGVQATISGGQAFIPVANIGDVKYASLADALEATKTMTGDVTVEILDKVTFNQPLIGNYASINFVGKAENAEMYLDVQGYTTATGKEVTFTDLKLSKSVGGYVANAGFMNVAFGIYDVKKVSYNNCTFLNGACASSGDVTFNSCTFYRSHDRYGLWAYGAPNVTVEGCTFADIRGIKLWDEGKQKLGALTVKNTNFSAVTDKPAIVLTSGKSVTLDGNTYNTEKGALELDLDGNPNGTPLTFDVAPTCVNDNGACGVLVDGKIYTTVAQAAEVATSGSTVKLLHNSAETVELAEGVVLDKNGFEAAGVTVYVKPPVAKIGDTPYYSLAEALADAKTKNLSEVVITIIGENTAATADKFNLYQASVFNKVTFKQENGNKPYYFEELYTGSRTDNGQFVFDGVNLVVTGQGQYIFEGNVVLSNNSLIKSIAEANCFVYNAEVTVEAGSKIDGVIEDIRGGSLIIDGGKTDGTYCETPGLRDAILVVNWAKSNLVLRNGAYVNINAANEIGRLTVTGTLDVTNSKLDSYQWIEVNGSMKLNAGSLITTQQVKGAGTITIDATDMAAGDVVNLTANLSGFTGTLSVINNDKLEAKIVDGKIVLAAKPVAKIGEQGYATLDEAFKAATSDCTIDILSDVTVDSKWDCRYTGSKFTVPVTINGNGKTIKFTAAVNDNNWNTVFRFEENATVNNLTVDISNATGAQRVISAKKSLNVDGLNIVGAARYGVIYGEGASATDLAATEIVVKNSTLGATRRAVSDNEGGKDVKSVVIEGNTFNANVYVSASESIAFNDNTVNGETDLRSYAADNVLNVQAQDNTLATDKKNYIYAKTIVAQDGFETKNPPLKVATKAELNAALAAAKEGDVITLTADIDYGTDQLAIAKAITLDLGGKTLTTRNAYGGMSIKGNPTVKNGNIVHASNTAAIKVWNATAFEDLVIDVQGKGDANKTIGGIVLQSGSTTRVGSIKNVTIKGAALTNGIETYNCGDATENVIGAMENVTIDAQGTGMLISAPCGTATNCSIKGGTNGIEIWIKGNYSASLDLKNSTVEGGVYAHDEFNSNPGVVNIGKLSLTADENTTGASAADVTLTLARAENVAGVVKEVKESAKAKVNDTYYATLDAAIKAVKAGDVVTVFEGTYAMPAMKAGITVVGQGNVMFEGTLTGTLENLTMKNIHIKGGNAQRWAYAKGNLVFENVTFEATSVYALHFDGITAGATLSYKNCTIIGWAAMSGSPASCKFDGCTFNGNGTYGLIRTYFDATIENCTFDVADVNTKDKYQDGIHAVNGATVTVTNCKNANGDMKEIINIEGTSAVVLDGQVLKNVAKVGDKKFATLDEAIKAADANGKVTLLQDITLTATTDISKAITLDGDNHKLTVSGDRVNALTVSAAKDKTVTFKNLEIECTGYGAGSITAGIYNSGKNNLVLENVKVLSSNYGIFSLTDNIVVSNSTLKGDMYAIYSSVEADIQLNGSTLEKTKNYGAGSAIYVQKSGSKLDIVNSTITAYAPQANIVAAIEIGDNNVEMNIDKNSTITIEGNNIYVVYVGDKMYNSKKITNGNYNIAAGATIKKPNAMLPTIFIKDSNVQLVKDNVAPVMCFTLQDAVNDVAEGQTVQLINNLELSEVATVAKDKSVTLDLNGKTLSTAFVAGSTTNHLYAIHNYGELTITDSSDAKAGKISARGNYNYGKLTLETGTIDACDGNGGYAVKNFSGSEFIMNGGAVTASYEDGDTPCNGYDATTVRVESGAKATINGGVINNSSNYTFAIDNAGEVTVNGGTVTSVHSTVSNYGTLTINDGSFTCNGLEGVTAHALVAWDGSTSTINGGTFDGKDNNNGFNVYADKGANVVITGGNFRPVHSGSLYGEGTITVSGGTFFDKIADSRCALGYQAVANAEGTYGVTLTNKRDSYTIEDGKVTEFKNEHDIEVGTLTYKRTFNNANWQALYLPFEVPVSALTDQFDITYIYDVHTEVDEQTYEPTGRTYVEQVRVKSGTLQANYPYLIRRKADADKELVLTLTDATLCKAVETTIDCSSVLRLYEVTGTYHKMTPENGLLGMWALKSGVWERATESSYLNPFRVYIKITDRAGVPVDLEVNSVRMFIRGEEEVTGINGTKFDTQGENFIYDLQGRRVANPVKGGIYIINGKKVYYNK